MTQQQGAKRRTSGQLDPKLRVWGASPSKHFSSVYGHLNCLPFRATPVKRCFSWASRYEEAVRKKVTTKREKPIDRYG